MTTSKLDGFIQPALVAVLARSRGTYFTKKEITAEVLRNGQVAAMHARLKKFGGWSIDRMFEAEIESRVTGALHATDAAGLRVFLNYKADHEFRWEPFVTIARQSLSNVASETKDRGDVLIRKANVYHAAAGIMGQRGMDRMTPALYGELVEMIRTGTI